MFYGNNDSRNPCKVTLPNYKYFQKRIDPTTPGCRGLYLGYHISCQAVLEDNSYTYLVSLTIYNLWNHFRCSVGNVYIPSKKHSLQVRYKFSEVFTWLQNHTNHPSILLGDFNMSTADLQDKLTNSNLGNWFVLPINGSPISWTRGRYSSDIDHAVVNSCMLDKNIKYLFCITYSSMIFLIIVNNCDKYGISVGDKRCCEGLFAGDIVLCAPTRSKLKKLLKFASKWARNNEMQFGINKCASLVVRGEISRCLNNGNPTFLSLKSRIS